MPAGAPIKLELLVNLPDAWDSCVFLAVLTVPTDTGAVKCEFSVYVDTESFYFIFFILFFIFLFKSWKRTLRSSRIATLTKTQHIYCTQFADVILNYTPRLLALTMEFVGIWPGFNVELKQFARS